METPAAASMGLACQSLLVRDDGGGVRHPFQYGGAGPTSASELKHRISGVVSTADHAMLRKDSMDFGWGLADRRRRVVRPPTSVPGSTVTNSMPGLASTHHRAGNDVLRESGNASPEGTAAESSLKQVVFAFPIVAPFRKPKCLAMPTQKKSLRLDWAVRLCS